MKKYTLSILTLSAMLFSGCQKENTEITEVPYNGEVRLTSGIELTRASGTNWAQNDKVGIYMLNNTTDNIISKNIQYNTTTNGTSATFGVVNVSQTIYYPQTGTVDLFGYYPFQSSMSSYIYKVNVSTTTTLSAIDLMVSDKLTNKTKTHTPQALNFKHKLSNIVLTINNGTGTTAENLKNITATINETKTTADYDLKTNNNKFSNIANKAKITMEVTNNGRTAEAFVIPQSSAGVTLKFWIPYIGNFTTSLPTDLDKIISGNQTNFQSGSKYTFTVTINRTEMGLVAKITEWNVTDGGSLAGDEVTKILSQNKQIIKNK